MKKFYHQYAHKEIPAREAALRILWRIDVDRAFVDPLLNYWLKGVPQRERSFVRGIVLGTTMWRGRIDWILGQFVERPLAEVTPWIRNILRMGTYQILFLDRTPDWAVIDESVKLARIFGHQAIAGFVNAVLRKVTLEKERIAYPDIDTDPVKAISVRYSHPAWMVQRWIDRHGIQETKTICQTNNERPTLTIRVNRLKTTLGDIQECLKQEWKIETEIMEGFRDFLAVPEPDGLFDTEIFKEGWFIVQDPSAGIPVLLLDPRPGETILDMCSAPGGKASHIAMLTGDYARITAVEKYPGRVALLQENLNRLGVSGVSVACSDATTIALQDVVKMLDVPSRKFDKVLVDAPCSGTGTLSKKSDTRWHRSEKDIGDLIELQGKLLDTATRLVKQGGVIVYSTCSIEHEENEGIVEAFLRHYPAYQLKSVPAPLSRWGGTMIRTFRHRDGIDGSFCVRLQEQTTV